VAAAKRRGRPRTDRVNALEIELKGHAKRLDDHEKRLDELAHLPTQVHELKVEFALLREKLMGMLGSLGLHQRVNTRVQLAIAETLAVEVTDDDRNRLDRPLPGEPAFPVKAL
jgi:hypothetical protein